MQEASQRQPAIDLVGKTAARLQLLLGPEAALREIDIREFNIATGEHASATETEFLWGPLVQKESLSVPQHLFDQGGADLLLINENLLKLTSMAVSSSNYRLKFIFLWIALEGHIGSGRMRRDFFEKEIGSKKLSAEVQRLHRIRSQIVHQGKFEPSKAEIVILFEIVRLSSLAESTLREHLTGC